MSRFSIAFLIVVLASTNAYAATRTKIAVLDLEAKGVPKDTVATLSDVVAVALKKLGAFDVISRGDVQQMLDFEESKQLVGCISDSHCIAEIGGALGVAKVVSGVIGQVGSSYVVTLTLFDTKKAQAIKRESRQVAREDALVREIEAAARFLVRSLLEAKKTELIVQTSEALAEIELDGLLVGISPMPRMKIGSGPHTLRVTKKTVSVGWS